MPEVNKKVKLNLVGLDGNAFVLIAAFANQAKHEGWTDEEIKEVVNECVSSNYEHVIATLQSVCES